MLQNQGQYLLHTLRAYQCQFSLGVSSPVGKNIKMKMQMDKYECMNRKVGERDGQTGKTTLFYW